MKTVMQIVGCVILSAVCFYCSLSELPHHAEKCKQQAMKLHSESLGGRVWPRNAAGQEVVSDLNTPEEDVATFRKTPQGQRLLKASEEMWAKHGRLVSIAEALHWAGFGFIGLIGIILLLRGHGHATQSDLPRCGVGDGDVPDGDAGAAGDGKREGGTVPRAIREDQGRNRGIPMAGEPRADQAPALPQLKEKP